MMKNAGVVGDIATVKLEGHTVCPGTMPAAWRADRDAPISAAQGAGPFPARLSLSHACPEPCGQRAHDGTTRMADAADATDRYRRNGADFGTTRCTG